MTPTGSHLLRLSADHTQVELPGSDYTGATSIAYLRPDENAIAVRFTPGRVDAGHGRPPRYAAACVRVFTLDRQLDDRTWQAREQLSFAVRAGLNPEDAARDVALGEQLARNQQAAEQALAAVTIPGARFVTLPGELNDAHTILLRAHYHGLHYRIDFHPDRGLTVPADWTRIVTAHQRPDTPITRLAHSGRLSHEEAAVIVASIPAGGAHRTPAGAHARRTENGEQWLTRAWVDDDRVGGVTLHRTAKTAAANLARIHNRLLRQRAAEPRRLPS